MCKKSYITKGHIHQGGSRANHLPPLHSPYFGLVSQLPARDIDLLSYLYIHALEPDSKIAKSGASTMRCTEVCQKQTENATTTPSSTAGPTATHQRNQRPETRGSKSQAKGVTLVLRFTQGVGLNRLNKILRANHIHP